MTPGAGLRATAPGCRQISLPVPDFSAKFTNPMLNAGMARLRSLGSVIVLALLYFGGIAFACLLGRLDGGVAMIWVSSAILAAWLFAVDRARWPLALGACALANLLGTGLFGMGWAVAPALTLANMVEALAVATLARHTFRRHWPDATFELVSVFLLGTILVIPAGSALIAAGAVYFAAGIGFVDAFHDWMLGHAVGFVAILPFAMILGLRLTDRSVSDSLLRRASDGANRDARRATAAAASDPSLTDGQNARMLISMLIVATMALLDVCVFLQDSHWPLAAPLLFALFAAVWADVLVATAMPMVVALIGTPLTVAGIGPIAPGITDSADRLQLSLIYAGLVACCCLPVIVEQARRRRELARLSNSAAHFEAMSQRADSLIDELRLAALTDPLTGLPNRRAFFEALAVQAASGEPACVAMVDIDHFKLVNDRYGHAVGDAVLRHFAEMARTTFRAGDMVGRIGGEEFAVILRGVDLDQACSVCQRLVDRLAMTDIDTAKGPVRVTISSGIAAIGSDGEAAMADADSALYRAKGAGRSRLSSVA